jgi:cyclase
MSTDMSADHAAATDPGQARLAEVSDGVFAYVQPDGSWWINNAGFLVGQRGVVSVDTCSTEERTRRYREAIASVSRLPVRTVVNTHHHGDHTFGNYQFDGATIVAQERARAAMLDWGLPRSTPYWTEVEWGAVSLEPPFLTFTDEVVLWVDDLRCEIRYVGTAAHTTNDSIVWIPERGVLFSGDLIFNGGTPFLLQGSVAGAIRVLTEQLQPLPAVTIVPGHGEPCGPEVIATTLGYLNFVWATAEAGRIAGLTPLQAAYEVDLGPYADLTDAERIVGNLHRAYADLGGAEPGDPIDLAAAFADMIAYNGGEPLRCYA